MKNRGAIPLTGVLLSIAIFASDCGDDDMWSGEEIRGPKYHASLEVDGVSKDLESSWGFTAGPLCLPSAYCVHYFDGDRPQENALSIGLPRRVSAGSTYTQDSIGFRIFYHDPDDRSFELKRGLPFNLTVTRWDGYGGHASGSFSGVLEDSITAGSRVTVTDGTFEAGITMDAGD